MKRGMVGALLVCPALLFGKPVQLSVTEDQDPRLRYTVFTDGEAEIVEQLEAAFAEEKETVVFTGDRKSVPDLALSFSGKSYSFAEPVEVVFLDEESPQAAVKMAVGAVRSRFFTGDAPVVSTVFEAGKEGYKLYRIPSIIKTGSGALVAFIEARGVGRTDCAENDIVVKISRDNGSTWSAPVLAVSAGEASLNNPSPVYIEEENRILLMYQYYPPKSYEVTTARGYEGPNVCRTFTISSTDDGASWSEPVDVTSQVKTKTMSAVACGPGIGIRVQLGAYAGRILYPFASTGRDEGWYNYLVYSDDKGKSWKIANGVSWYGTNESQVIELAENRFLVNARNHRYPGNSVKAPVGWNPWSRKAALNRAEFEFTVDKNGVFHCGDTVTRFDMPDPRCQGFIYRFSGLKPGEKSILLFSNAASSFYIRGSSARFGPGRVNGSVKISLDEGRTYDSRRIYGGRFTGFQYSVLVKIDENRVGCLFECLPDVKFAVIDLDWLTPGKK